ncbi:hypothetical protein SCHAM137S_02116 [Streptomyces chartreusis]
MTVIQSPCRHTPGVGGEVGVVLPAAVGVVPEVQRHRRHGAGDNQLAHATGDRPALGVVGGQRPAQIRRGQLARPDGDGGRSAREAGDDVGAAADGGELDVLADVLGDPGVGRGGQGGAGAADGTDGRQVVDGGVDAELGHAEQVLGAGAEDGEAVPGRQLPQEVGPGERGRAAVVRAGGGAGQEGGDDQVPHHPVGSRVPEQAVSGAEVGLEAEGLEVFEQHTAVAVDDALGQAGGAGGEDDPQGVVVAVGGDQHGGFELGESVGGCRGGVVLAAHRPHRAEARGGKERDDHVRGVGQIADHAVSLLDAQVAQGGGDGGDLGTQPPTGHLTGGAGLVQRDDRRFVGAQVAQGVVSVVERGPGEPAGTGHGLFGQYVLVRGGRVDVEVVPHRSPEALQVGDGPVVQGGVIGGVVDGVGAAGTGGTAGEVRDPAACRSLVIRCPDGGWIRRGHGVVLLDTNGRGRADRRRRGDGWRRWGIFTACYAAGSVGVLRWPDGQP